MKMFVVLRCASHVTYSLLQGTTWNMASPALAGLVVDFFNTGPSALCSLFPEVFAQEVPKPTVCLATTAVRNCFFLGTFSCVFYSYGLLSMNTLSREFDRTTTSNTPLTPRFSCS